METFFDNGLAAFVVAIGVMLFLGHAGIGVRGWMTSRSRRHQLAADREEHERRLREIEKLDEVLAIMVADEAMADTLSERIEVARARFRVEVDAESEPEPPKKRRRRKKGEAEALPFVREGGRGHRR